VAITDVPVVVLSPAAGDHVNVPPDAPVAVSVRPAPPAHIVAGVIDGTMVTVGTPTVTVVEALAEHTPFDQITV
jgi:hypothetical protein